MYYEDCKGENAGRAYILGQTNNQAGIKKIMPKNARQKHWTRDKDRFMLTKGKIHNKEIMYMNLQTLYNMALL